MDLLRFASNNRTTITFAGIILLALFLFFGQSFILLVLVAASLVLSYFMGLWRIKSIGIELVLLTSVVTGILYGSLAGAVVAFLLITIHMLATQHVNVYLLWVIPAYAAAGYFAGTTELSITNFGILATIGLNAFNLLVTALVFRSNVAKFLPFAFTNVMFNSFLFMFVMPWVVS